MEHRWLKVLAPYRNTPLVLGCSGGVDSMVLLHLLHTHRFHVQVVHVNYHQRGADSDADEQLVVDYCQQHSIPCSTFHFNNASKKNKPGNFQERARHFRYTCFEKVVNSSPNAKIVLAHHADDQVDTFFLNLARKSGFMGLACMLPDSEQVLRPLLSATKHNLYEYAVQHDLRWREDQSNKESSYSRNKIRNEWIPFLEDHVPGIKSSVLTLIDVFQRNQHLLEANARSVVKRIQSTGRLELQQLMVLDKHLLFEIWRQLGQDAASFERFPSIFTSQKGKFVELSSPFKRVVREADYFYFERDTDASELPELVIETVEELPKQYTKDVIYLNPEKIIGDLKLRYWQVGDRIASLGMKGSQLVSDIISDAKIAHHQRDQVLVVSDEKDLHWVVGLKIGRLAAAGQDTAVVRVRVGSVTKVKTKKRKA